MADRVLNICLHNIVDEASEVLTIYDITKSQLAYLEAVLEKLRSKNVFSSYELFFDDGYKSFIKLARSYDFKIEKQHIHAAIITERLGFEGYMSPEDIEWIYNAGFSVYSHGVSHAALAIFSHKTLLNTPPSGTYQNRTYGKDGLLVEAEVRYQLVESSNSIEALIGTKPRSFVLPFGLYNEQTVFIAAAFSSYAKLYTCDKAFDTGQFLSPRLLVTQENMDYIEDEIINLTNEYIPLPEQFRSVEPK
jgi:hypothetical protein